MVPIDAHHAHACVAERGRPRGRLEHRAGVGVALWLGADARNQVDAARSEEQRRQLLRETAVPRARQARGGGVRLAWLLGARCGLKQEALERGELQVEAPPLRHQRRRRQRARAAAHFGGGDGLGGSLGGRRERRRADEVDQIERGQRAAARVVQREAYDDRRARRRRLRGGRTAAAAADDRPAEDARTRESDEAARVDEARRVHQPERVRRALRQVTAAAVGVALPVRPPCGVRGDEQVDDCITAHLPASDADCEARGRRLLQPLVRHGAARLHVVVHGAEDASAHAGAAALERAAGAVAGAEERLRLARAGIAHRDHARVEALEKPLQRAVASVGRAGDPGGAAPRMRSERG